MQEKSRNKKSKGGLAFLVVILLICAFIIGILNGDVPAIFGYRILHVVSGSMEPTLEKGSYILIKEMEPSKLQEGDIITFVSTEPSIFGMYNTHRIYDIVQDTYKGDTLFITKGDAFSEPDAYLVEETQVVGKLVRKLPFGKTFGNFMMYLSNSYVYFGLVIVPLLFCLISYIVQFVKVIISKEEQEE